MYNFAPGLSCVPLQFTDKGNGLALAVIKISGLTLEFKTDVATALSFR